MITAFADTARPDAAGPLTWRTWVALVVLPILVMSLFLWAFWAPESNHGAATAAVVNNDQPVVVDGQPIPLGRQLAAGLTNSTAAYSWVLTDADDARDGLARGDYGAVVTIPADFSAMATSSAGSNPLAAGQAEVRVQTSNATGVADPFVSTQIAQVVLRTVNQQIVRTYLDKVYLSFSTLHDQLDQAAAGAAQLAEGADDLAVGANQLTSGTGQLATGLSAARAHVTDARSVVSELQRQLQLPPPRGPVGQIERLAAGVDTAADGADQVDDGARRLDGGLHQLSTGAHQLATQLAEGRDRVPVYDQVQRERLSDVATTPAVAVTDHTDVGAAVAAVAVTLALWACALGTYFATRALPAAVLTSRRPTRRIVARAALPGATVAVLSALALSLILLPVLHLSLSRRFALLGVIVLTALTFMALNQAMIAVAHRVGRFGSIAVLVLAIVTSLTSTIPAALHTIGGYLPTHSAILALRGVIIGSATTSTGLIQLAVWLIAPVMVTVTITEQRRLLSGRQLRLGSGPTVAA